MKKYAYRLLGLLCLLPLVAQSQVYKWRDADGSTVYSQLPPPPEITTETVAPPPPPATSPEQSLQQLREMERRLEEIRKRRQTAQEKQRQEAERIAQRDLQCGQAKAARRRLEGIALPLLPDGAGGYRRMPAEEREAELQRLRGIIDEVCR